MGEARQTTFTVPVRETQEGGELKLKALFAGQAVKETYKLFKFFFYGKSVTYIDRVSHFSSITKTSF